MASAQIQCWPLTHMITTVHKLGKEYANVDELSRLTLPNRPSNIAMPTVTYVFSLKSSCIRHATSELWQKRAVQTLKEGFKAYLQSFWKLRSCRSEFSLKIKHSF